MSVHDGGGAAEDDDGMVVRVRAGGGGPSPGGHTTLQSRRGRGESGSRTGLSLPRRASR